MLLSAVYPLTATALLAGYVLTRRRARGTEAGHGTEAGTTEASTAKAGTTEASTAKAGTTEAGTRTEAGKATEPALEAVLPGVPEQEPRTAPERERQAVAKE